MISLYYIIFLFGINASWLNTPDKIDLIEAGQSAVFDCRWQQADSIFTELHHIDDTDPAGFLFRAAALQAEMTDKEENLYGDKFLNLCDSAITAAETRLGNCTRRDSALCYLYLGDQYAYRSLWESRFRSNFSALKLGMKAKSAYQKGLEVDSTLYDLYLGLGNYHYWKSVKSGLLRSFGLFKDEREKSIDEIELAVDSSLFSGDAALAALIWIMIDEKNYDSAMIPAMELNRKYPNGNTFLWPLGEIYFNSGQYEKAAEIYDTLYQRLTDAPGNYYNIVECLDRLHRSFDKLNNSNKKRETISKLHALYNNIPEETSYKQKEKLSYLMKQDY